MTSSERCTNTPINQHGAAYLCLCADRPHLCNRPHWPIGTESVCLHCRVAWISPRSLHTHSHTQQTHAVRLVTCLRYTLTIHSTTDPLPAGTEPQLGPASNPPTTSIHTQSLFEGCRVAVRVAALSRMPLGRFGVCVGGVVEFSTSNSNAVEPTGCCSEGFFSLPS